MIVIQRPIMAMFCRFGTLLRSITPPLLSPNSPHYGSKSIVVAFIFVYRSNRVTFYFSDDFFFNKQQ